MAATYAFDVTPADVIAEELAMQQDMAAEFNDLLEDAINRAASKLNSALRMHSLVPSSITAVNAIDDYNWCRDLIIRGAAGYFLRSISGAEDAGSQKLADMRSEIAEFKKAPQMLQSYVSTTSSTAGARSRANYNPGQSTDPATRRARERFLDPSNPRNWQQ